MDVEAIMDLSSFRKTEEFRRKLIKMSTAMIGTVPIYDAVGFYDKELKDISEKEFLDVVRKHGQDLTGRLQISLREILGLLTLFQGEDLYYMLGWNLTIKKIHFLNTMMNF